MRRISNPSRPGHRSSWTAWSRRTICCLVLVTLIVGIGGVSGGALIDTINAGTTVPPPFTGVTDTPTPPPIPAAGPPVFALGSPRVTGKTVTIIGSVRPGGPGVTLAQVVWDWGDGVRDTQNLLPVTHTYTAGGMYTVRVEARQSDAQVASTSLVVGIPTDPPTHVPTRLGAIVAYSADAYNGMAVVAYDGASDQYGYYTVYRYPGGRGWYRHQSDSNRHQESRSQIEGPNMVIVGTVDVSASLPIEARYVYPPFKYGMGDIVGETATGSFQVVTRVDEGNPSYYSPGGYTHKPVWKDAQGQWRTYEEGSVETYDARAEFEERYLVKLMHVELGTVIGGEPSPLPSTPTTPPTTTPPTTVPTPPPVSSPIAVQPTPIVIVVERTADIDRGMTPYAGLTAPPTTPELQSAATALKPAAPPAVEGAVITAATTTVAAQPVTYASAVATTAAEGDSGSTILLALGALIAVFGLVVGGIAYRSRVSARDAPVTVMSRDRAPGLAPTPIGPMSTTEPVEQLPWDGYSPLGSDSYDLLARLRRYEDGVRKTGLGNSIPIEERLDLALIPTLPIPASVRELGPGVGCRVLSVDHRGDAVCLRDPGTPDERLDVVPVEEILRLIEARYEQRWVPREP